MTIPASPDPNETRSLAAVPTSTEQVGTQIGRYKLLERIGEGGMGVVYLAEQTQPIHRRVALKLTLVPPPFVCPLRSRSGKPVRASHTFAVSSSLPVTMRAPSGLKLALKTMPVCPYSVNRPPCTWRLR